MTSLAPSKSAASEVGARRRGLAPAGRRTLAVPVVTIALSPASARAQAEPAPESYVPPGRTEPLPPTTPKGLPPTAYAPPGTRFGSREEKPAPRWHLSIDPRVAVRLGGDL